MHGAKVASVASAARVRRSIRRLRGPPIIRSTAGPGPNQPLFYRLLGDRNPLHVEPDFAALGGFERPIMHGLCTYGIACRAVVAAACSYLPRRVLDFYCQFAAPALPGDTIRTEIWIDAETAIFRCHAIERGVEVVVNGRARIARQVPEK